MRQYLLNSPNYKWFALVTIQLSIFLLGLDITLINVALPTITAHFPVTLLESHWLLSMYFIVAALLLPIAGKVSDLFKRKPIIILGCLIYGVGAFLSYFAPSLNVLILIRAVQGIGCAALLANTNVITMAVFPSHQRGLALGLNGSAYSLGFSLGFLFGGYLIDALGWRSIFILSTSLVTLALVASIFVLAEKKISIPPSGKKLSFDYRGALLLIFAIGSFMVGFQRWVDLAHLDSIVALLFLATICCIFSYVFFEKRTENPLIEMNLILHRTTFFGLFNRMWMQLLISATLIIIPFFSQIVLHLNAFHTGLLMISYSIALFFFAPFGGMLSRKIKFRILTTSGFLISGLGILILAFLSEPSVLEKKIAVVVLIVAALFLMGLGAGLFVFPNTTVTLSSTPTKSMGVIAGVMWVMVLFGNTFGTTFSAILLNSGLAPVGRLKELVSANQLSVSEINLFVHIQSKTFLWLFLFSIIGIILCWLNQARKINNT